MRSLLKLSAIVSLSALCGCAAFLEYLLYPIKSTTTIEDRWGSASEDPVAEALREALQVGTRRAISQASAVDGFQLDPSLRIEVPLQIRSLAAAAPGPENGCPVEELERDLNRAAERAAPGALGVFAAEIRALPLEDAQVVLNGGPTAATDQLRAAASAKLVDGLVPLVAQQLQQLELYRACVELDRRLPEAPAVSPPLVRHVARGAAEGLLVLLAREEARIREDPAARSSPQLREVFARTDAASAR
jgi:hypothetical protein